MIGGLTAIAGSVKEGVYLAASEVDACVTVADARRLAATYELLARHIREAADKHERGEYDVDVPEDKQ